MSDNELFQVLIDFEERYTIWPANRQPPMEWRSEGKVGTKQECLDYIDAVWTDRRPLSLRKAMERLGL
jgi:MbtH protein